MLHRSTKIIAIVGMGTLLVGLVVFTMFLRAVELHKESYVAQTKEQAELEARQVALSKLERTLEETEDERTSLLSRVLREEEVIDFLALVETLGDEQGVALSTDSLTVEPINALFEALVLGVTVRGSYEGVVQVLKILENLPYQATIAQVRLVKGSDDAGEVWQSTYSLRVTKYKKP